MSDKRYPYKVVGVTFDDFNGKSRQAHLKKLFDEEVELENDAHEIRIEDYTFEGSPALAVYLDDLNVGVIASGDIDAVSDLRDKADLIEAKIELNGHDWEDYRNVTELYRDRRQLVKDGTLSEMDVDELKDQLGEIKEDPIYSCILFFWVYDYSQEGETIVINAPSISDPEPMSKGKKAVWIFCLVVGVFSLLVALLMFVVHSIGAGAFLLILGALLAVLSIRSLQSGKRNE